MPTGGGIDTPVIVGQRAFISLSARDRFLNPRRFTASHLVGYDFVLRLAVRVPGCVPLPSVTDPTLDPTCFTEVTDETLLLGGKSLGVLDASSGAWALTFHSSERGLLGRRLFALSYLDICRVAPLGDSRSFA